MAIGSGNRTSTRLDFGDWPNGMRQDAERLRAESPLDGNELAAIFRREPGPWIRTVKERLSTGVLEGDLEPGDREGALALAKKVLEAE